MYMNGHTQHPIQHVHSTQAHLETKSRHTRIRAPAARFRVFSSKYLSTCAYYAIITNIGGNSEEELTRLAGQVLVSALAVPIDQHTEETAEEGKGKNARLTALIGLSKMPAHTGLLKDAVSSLRAKADI
jgi:hypothetical protein